MAGPLADIEATQLPKDPTNAPPTQAQVSQVAAEPAPVRVPHPQNFTERLSGLATTHNWMSHQTMATIAALPVSDASVASMAAGLEKAAGGIGKVTKYITDDPLLQKTPSLGLAVKSYLNSTAGPSPLADGDLVHVQKQLQQLGYGKGAKADGTWNNDWNTAFDLYKSNLKTEQLGGDQPGSSPVGTVLGWLNDLMPSHSVPAVVGFAKRIPTGARDDVRTVAGSLGATVGNIASAPGEIAQGHFNALLHNSDEADQLSAAFENPIPGAHVTPQTSFAEASPRTQAMDTISVVGDILATHGLFGAGKTIAQAAGQTSLKGLTMDEASRGPGAIAKSLYNTEDARIRVPQTDAQGNIVTDAQGKVVMRKGFHYEPAGPLSTSGEKGGLLGSRMFANVPIAKYVGPVADRAIGGRGLYYRARSLIATPYAYGPVRLAGTTIGQVGVAGTKIRALGGLESAVGGQTSGLQSAVDKYHGLDYINQQMENRLAFTVLGHHIRPGIDTLAWFMHPPVSGVGAVSTAVGGDIGKLHQALDDAQGPSTGYAIQLERGWNNARAGMKPMSTQDMVDHFGGADNYRVWAGHKIVQHAAAHYADVQFPKLDADAMWNLLENSPNELTDELDPLEVKKYLAHEAYMDPHLLARSMAEMIANNKAGPGTGGMFGGPHELSQRISKEILASEGRDNWLRDNGPNWSEAAKLMRSDIVPRLGEMYADEITKGTIGMAQVDGPSAYKFKDLATGDAATFRKEYDNLRMQMSKGTDPEQGGKPEYKDAFPKYQALVSQMGHYLMDTYGVQGDQIPTGPQDEALIAAIEKRAEAQAPRIFPRLRPSHKLPEDLPHGLRVGAENSPASTLDQKSVGPLYRNTNSRDAMDTLFSEEPGGTPQDWHNTRNTAGKAGVVTIEHDPEAMHGFTQPNSTFERLQGQARFTASRFAPFGSHTGDGLEGVRSVEIKPVAAGNEAENKANLALGNRLKAAGYVAFDAPGKGTRWVRPDLAVAAHGASPQLIAAMEKLEHDYGYAPVMGRDIGHAFVQHPLVDVMDGKLSTTRKMVGKAGVSLENIPTHDIGFQYNLNAERNILNAVQSGDFRLLNGDSVGGILAKLREGMAFRDSPGLLFNIQRYGTGHWSWKRNFDAVFKEVYANAESEPGAEDKARQEAVQRLAGQMDSHMGLLHIQYGQLKRILGGQLDVKDPKNAWLVREREFNNQKMGLGADDPQIAAYSDQQLQVLMRALQKSKAQMPWRMVGLQGLEDIGLQKLSYLGRAFGNTTIGRAVENMPAHYTSMRNKLRFSLSPEFSTRRLVKAVVKTSLDGVPPTLSPYRALRQIGKEDEAHELIDRIMPEWKPKSTNYDEGTQVMYAEDAYGIYDHRNQEAWSAYHWHKMGLSDTEIRSNLVKDFGYGSERFGEGRTAAERSLNFVFFPVSFDKTLYRNVGAYLLDHNAQRMMLTAGLSAYHQWNLAHPEGDTIFTSSWFQKHVPLMQEALRLNAFAHGIGVGQFGGINAPVLNLFIPQSYNSDNAGLQALKGFFPMAREFQDLGQEVGQQWQVSKEEIDSATQGLSPKSIYQPQPVAETSSAQLYDAYAYRRRLNNDFAQYIHFNAHTHDSKMTLPNKPEFGIFGGRIINSTLINELTHAKYNAFPIDGPSVFYAQQQGTINSYELQMHAAGHDDVAEWLSKVPGYAKAIYDGTVSGSEAQQYTSIIRRDAVKYAETVPGFLNFYNTNFSWQFGPIEGVG